MKYESSILKRLIDTYGVIGNPRYLSEIIKEFIVRGKELYPQLFTYQSDWLAHIDEFGLTPDYVVSYTGQQIYAPHTKERPVKSAILKGQTLVNLVSSCAFGGDVVLYEYRFYDQPIKSGETLTIFVVNPNVTTIKVGKHSEVTGNWEGEITYDVSTVKKVVYTVPTNFICKYVGVIVTNNNDSTGFENALVIVRGDQSHLDVDTYFDGMQSVKMPVLTTTGKNLFDGKLEYGAYSSQAGEKIIDNNCIRNVNMIKVQKGSTIYKNKNVAYRMREYREDGTFINTNQLFASSKLKLSDETAYISFYFLVRDDEDGINSKIILTPSIDTSYEPYKTNILTVNEDVTLRGVGEVRDELDLLTGEVTERIGEVVLDGSDSFSYLFESNSNEMTTMVHVPIPNTNRTFKFYNDKLVEKFIYENTSTTEGIFSEWNGLYIRLLNSKLQSANIEGVKKYLQENPITVQYELAQESVKTVDLTNQDQNGQNVKQLMSFNGGTHFSTSSQDGSLQPTIIVDVVTDLEETLKVCSLEGNTL